MDWGLCTAYCNSYCALLEEAKNAPPMTFNEGFVAILIIIIILFILFFIADMWIGN